MSTTTKSCNKKAFGLISIGHLISDSYGGFITPLLPIIAIKLGITISTISMILSFTHLTSSISQPLFGHISDTVARRFFIVWGPIFAAVFVCMAGIVSNVWLLTLVLLLGSLGVGFYHPQATSLAGFYSGNNINKYMGIFTSMGTLGYASGPIISSFIAEAYGIESIIWALIPGLLFGILVYYSVPKIPAIETNTTKEGFKKTFFSIFQDKMLLSLTIISIIKALLMITFSVYMPFLWKEIGYPVYITGMALGINAALGGIGSISGGKLADIIGRKNIFKLSLIPSIPIAAGVLFFLKSVPVLSFSLYAILGFFVMLSVSVNIVMAQFRLPERKGIISGVIGGFSWGVAGLSLTPLGLLAAKFGIIPVLGVITISPIAGVIALKYINE